MVGLYRGGKRYEVHFEMLSPAQSSRPADQAAWTEALMTRYAERVAHYCREAPHNWFNFYDFWA
jgi:predicted LPLAT superfamily acyltransferase